MLKTLRRRFIAVSMLSMCGVLALIVAFINISNYRTMMDTIASRANIAREISSGTGVGSIGAGGPPGLPGNERGDAFGEDRRDKEARFDTRFFTVSVGSDGRAADADVTRIASVSSSEAEDLAEKVYAKGDTEGIAGGFYYVSEGDGDGRSYLFLDVTRELSSFASYLRTSILVSVFGALVVFVLIFIFSRTAMKPVAESYEKQKRFITDASHEIKTPLAIIGANAEVLEMEGGENEWLTAIRHQIDRLTGLTEKLVFLSKMDEEGSRLSMQAFNLSAAAEETAEAFTAMAEARGLTFERSIVPDLTYYGDEERIRQLISLLLENAMKYTTADGRVSLSLQGAKRRTARGGGGERIAYTACVLKTENTAEGLEQGPQDRLFDRFYRADSSRSAKTGGTGIGLSVVRAIAEAHRGSANAVSRDGKSIEFTIRLG